MNVKRASIRNSDRSMIQDNLLIKDKNFQLLEQFSKPWYCQEKQKKNKLGLLYKATLKQEDVICRKVEFDRITNYTLEDYFTEVSVFEQIKMRPFLVPFLGYYIKDQTLMIFHSQMISIYDLLYCPQKQDLRKLLTQKEKFQICFDIAKIFYTFHSFNP